MEIRTETRNWMNEDRTLKNLSLNVEALLCYLGGWISEIVLLVLEQKNRFIRFHALTINHCLRRSVIAEVVLGKIPVIRNGFSCVDRITGFTLWIILMVKAVNGELFKMPWAGDLAERLTNNSMGQPSPRGR